MADEDGGRGLLERLANDGRFVALVYVFAFGPWVVYGVIDHVDCQWRKVEDLRLRTRVGTPVCFYAIWLLLFYAATQLAAADWKEGMAALVVFFAAWLPWLRFSRQWWLLSASWNFRRVLRSLPHFGGYSFWGGFQRHADPRDFDDGDSWTPGNSNKFFDNDDPGEGITDISLLASLLQQKHMTQAKEQLDHVIQGTRQLDASFFTRYSEQVESLYQTPSYDLAMDVVRYRLQVVVTGDPRELYERSVARKRILWESVLSLARERPSFRMAGALSVALQNVLSAWETCLALAMAVFRRSKPAKASGNGITRSLWLYENLTGQGWLEGDARRGKLAQVLHLGLVIHVGMVLVQGFTPERLDWIHVLAGPSQHDAPQPAVRRPLYGHLKMPGLLLWEWFLRGQLRWFQVDDFDEVFAKLPPERSSLKKRGHLRWENVMFMACSTIELHAFVEVLFGTRAPTVLDIVQQMLAWGYLVFKTLLWLLQILYNGGDSYKPLMHCGTKNTIWTYVAGAFVANHGDPSTGEQQMLHAAIRKLPEDYKARLQNEYIDGSCAEANWDRIILHCGNIVDVVTNALQREAPQGRPLTLMPEARRNKPWHIQLLETRDDLIDELKEKLPSYKQLMVDGNTSHNIETKSSAPRPAS